MLNTLSDLGRQRTRTRAGSGNMEFPDSLPGVQQTVKTAQTEIPEENGAMEQEAGGESEWRGGRWFLCRY